MDHDSDNSIDRVVRSFGEATGRAKASGLDGLETMVHGYLIGQFLSPATNMHTDSVSAEAWKPLPVCPDGA